MLDRNYNLIAYSDQWHYQFSDRITLQLARWNLRHPCSFIEIISGFTVDIRD